MKRLVFLLTSMFLLCAWTHGNSGGSFNNGKTEVQSTVPGDSGDYAFINMIKSQGSSWLGNQSPYSGGYVPPSWLDSNGYPLASIFPTNTPYISFGAPNSNSKAATSGNPFVVTWEGNAQVGINNIATTFVGGTSNHTTSTYDSGSGLYKGRMEFYPTYDANGNASFFISAENITGGSYLANLQLYFLSDESSLLAGEIFAPQYLSQMRNMGAGVIRFMDWIYTNRSSAAIWANRKSYNYVTWSDDEFRANLYPGDIMTNSGNSYALSTGSFTIADRLTMHVHFNATSTYQINTTNPGPSRGGSPGTLSVALTPQLTFTWTSHPFSNGNIVGFYAQGNFPTGMNTYQNYYVVNATANTFQVATTSGGTAISPASLGSGQMGVEGIPTLSLNGGTAYPIKNAGSGLVGSSVSSTYQGSPTYVFGTIIFDNYLQSWLLQGGTGNGGDGLVTAVPIEVCFQLAKELGAHPYFSIPYLALDPMSDFAPSLATYLKNNAPPWMIPRFEPANEVWNQVTAAGDYAAAKAAAYWSGGAWPDYMGMIASTLGQAVATVYGSVNLGTKYEVLASFQTDDSSYQQSNPGALDPVLTSASYVSSGPSQSGYTQTAAYNWVSAIAPSVYISPWARGRQMELQLSFDYYWTSIANPTQQAADLNAYVNTLSITGSVTFTNGSANVSWTAVPSQVAVNSRVVFTGGSLPANISAGIAYWVTSTSTNSIQVSATQSGGAITASGNGSGSVALASGGYTTDYEALRWHGASDWASRFGVNKMFSYEGGYSPDFVQTYQDYAQINGIQAYSSFYSSPESTLPVTGSPTQITINNTTSNPDGNVESGNPAKAGMLIMFEGSGFPFIVNNATGGGISFSSSAPDIGWTAHNLHPNEVVQFVTNGNLPSNITGGPTVRYYVISTNLTTNTFQVSLTRGGTAVQPNTTVSGQSAFSAFVVTSVSGTTVNLDCDSTGASTPTASMSAYYPNSLNYANNFRLATQLYSTAMQTQITYAINQFALYGGTFFAQYEFAGSGNIWPLIQPDIWGASGGEYAAYKAYNGH